MKNKTKNAELSFRETKCLLCERPEDKVLYPERLCEESFTGYSFSARRLRKCEHYRIVKCAKCSLVRSSPVIEENKLNELYAESEFIFSDEAPYAADTYINLLKKLIGKYSLKSKSLTEIGCSTGFFLEKAMETGIEDLLGFEPSRQCREHTKERLKGMIVNDVFRPETLGDKKFDLACSFHTIDHLMDPKSFLTNIKNALNPGGHALIVCHDVESWSAKLLGENSPIFDVEHIYLFSLNTISMLFRRTGFRVVEAGTLSNTYPVGYWMRMMPVANKAANLLPDIIKKIPLGVKAGNLYILGENEN